MENGKYPYQKQWEKFRFWDRVWLIMFPINFIPLLFLEFSSISKHIIAFLAILLWTLFIGVTLKIIFWKCPRCNKFFFRWWKKINLSFDYECKNCGLERYSGSTIKSFGKRFGF